MIICPIVCTDLDRTLIYSANALELGSETPRLRCVEIYRGAPRSYMTERAAELLRTLQAHVVPSTTRTVEQLARVRLPGASSRYAIASNGGHLLVDGVPDRAWTAHVSARLAWCAPLAEVESHLRAAAGPFVTALRVASGLFVYAVVDRSALPAAWVDALAAWCAPRGWTVSLQGRKVYAVPRPLTKAAAAVEIRERLCGGPLLAAGDSLLDADLLDVADAAIRPAHGELAEAGFTRDHLTVTDTTGVRAGEEMLAWMHARTTPATTRRTTPSWRCGTS
jgi:hypothetical protein